MSFSLQNQLNYARYIYQYLGLRFVLLLVLSFLVAMLDGFGLAFIMALLGVASGEADLGQFSLGNFDFILVGFDLFGLEVSLRNVLIFLIVLFSIKGLIVFCETYYNIVLKTSFMRKLRFELLGNVVGMSYLGFTRSDAGTIQNSMTQETNRVMSAYTAYLIVVKQSIMLLVYASLAFWQNTRVSLFVVMGGVLFSLIFRYFYKLTKRYAKELTYQGNTFHSRLIQVVSFFKYLKATNSIEHYSNRLRKSIDDILNTTKRIGFVNSILGSIREPLIMLIVAAVLLVELVVYNSTIGIVLLSLAFLYRALYSLVGVQKGWNDFYGSSFAMQNLKTINKSLSQVNEETGSEQYPGLQQNIQLNDLSFSYNNEVNVLSKVSAHIQKNKTVAIVGESGSGKTTIANIISGLLTPTAGELSIDSINLKKINSSQFREKVGYITQEQVIFNDDVFNNVTLWDEKSSENIKRFEKALMNAQILEFVSELDKGMDTSLGDKGVILSGGQKQRICIARELYKNVDILILDEATSALDSETEKAIQESIELMKGKVTIVMIAHRLSTVKFADQIWLMNKGQIEDQGSFNELINRSDRFKNMVELQEF